MNNEACYVCCFVIIFLDYFFGFVNKVCLETLSKEAIRSSEPDIHLCCFCTDAAGTEGYKSSDHTEETPLFSVEQPLLSAGYLPGALPTKVN